MSKLSIAIETNSDHIARQSDWISIARELYKLHQIRKELAKEEKKLQQKLLILSNNKNSKGGGFLFTCILRKGSVDYAQVKELQGIDLEPYRKDSVVTWKLSKV